MNGATSLDFPFVPSWRRQEQLRLSERETPLRQTTISVSYLII